MLGRFGCVFGLVLLSLLGTCAAGAQTMTITSVTFSAPAPLTAGDMITVDLAGTPGVRAAFSVKGLIAPTQLKEMSAGSYHGTVKVPAGKIVKNAPLVGYLGNESGHAAPVQASRLITVSTSRLVQPDKLPPVLPEPHVKVAEPTAPPTPKPAPAVQPAPKPAPLPAPVKAEEPGKIVFVYPADGAVLKRSITIKGNARPDSTVKIAITYNNNMSGLMKLAGEVATQNVATGKNGEFRMGPIALDGPLATDGLRFTIKAYYPDRAQHETAEVTVTGKRE